MILVGKPPKGYKGSTMVVVVRKARSKYWNVACFGPKGHYAKDGTCCHTDEVVARTNPSIIDRLRLLPFGDKDARTIACSQIGERDAD